MAGTKEYTNKEATEESKAVSSLRLTSILVPEYAGPNSAVFFSFTRTDIVIVAVAASLVLMACCLMLLVLHCCKK
jgi:hypothetical protein